MALLGDLDHAKRLIRASDSSPFTADEEARLDELQKAVTAYIEEETGRTFGAVGAAEAVVVAAPGVSDVLVLPKGVRAVASIRVGATWDGATWAGGALLDADDYLLVYRSRTGEALGILSTVGVWHGPVVVTGTWEDADADATVPDDIQYAATYLIAERFKAEKSSAIGTLGPDGATVIPTRNPFKDALIRAAIDHWSVRERVVV